MGERVGILDVGSNSVRLLVADLIGGQAFSIHMEKITSRLLSGMALGVLSAESLERTAKAIEILAESARALGCVRVCGFGTSAMRDGRNSGELIDRARASGVPLRVLSGEEEARMAYAGAAPEGRMGVMDIGGGSTELLAGESGRPAAAYSAQIGAVRLSEMGASDPVARAVKALSPAWEAVRDFPVDGWVGVGGTVTSLAAMSLALPRYDAALVEGFRLTQEAVKAWYGRLATMTLEEKRALPGLNPERADIIYYGAAIVLAFFALSGADYISASDRDNLLGFASTL